MSNDGTSQTEYLNRPCDKPYRVEIGAGISPAKPGPKWIHTDIFNYLSCNCIEHICPAWDLPFPDKSVQEIYLRGTWEHFTFKECIKVIEEFERVLISGGTATFNFPPTDHAIQLYERKKVSWKFLAQVLWGAQGNEYGNVLYSDVHKSGWTQETFIEWMKQFPEFTCETMWSEYDWGVELKDPMDCPGGHIWVRLTLI